MTEVQEVKLHRQYCGQNDAKAIEPGANRTLLIVIVSRVGGEQKYRKAGREYRHHENNKRMNPFVEKKHPCRLRKSTERTGIRMKIYRKRAISSSERKPESSRRAYILHTRTG